MIIGIDHALIAVDDLDSATATYERLGFQVIRGGRHPQHGTHNALVPLSDGFYLELMGVWDRSLASHYPHTNRVVRALDADHRLALFALDSDDLDADVEAIRQRGLAISDPVPGERERPDGERVAWRTAHPDDPRLPFLIEDVTPRSVRVPEASEGIGAALQVSALDVESRDPERARSHYAGLVGQSASNGVFRLGRGAIRVRPADIAGGLLALALAIDDLARVRDRWSSHGVAFDEVRSDGDRSELRPRATAGASLRIV